MFDSLTQKLLHEKLPDLPLVVMEHSLRHDADELVAGILPVRRLAVVSDPDTFEAYGHKIVKALSRFDCKSIELPKNPVADDVNAAWLRQQSKSADAIIAVGSGTINDLCKYVSHQDGKPYLVFPTAASMNGYLSANASISVEGYKKTLPAHMPRAVLCDLSVIAAAYPRLNKSGLGDSLARPTAQADWLLSHLLLGTAYDATPFELLAPFEPQLFDNARGIALGDEETIRLLMQVLLLSGLGMTIAGGSYPASQGEHMIAHAYEMLRHTPSPLVGEGRDGGYRTLHGEEIGVTTLTMAKLQEELLRKPLRLRMDTFDHHKITQLFGDKIAEEARKFFGDKQKLICHASEGWHPRPATTKMHGVDPGLRRDDISRDWEAIATRLERVMIPSAQLQSILAAAQAPTTIEGLGWSMADYRTAGENARFLRDRFTFLDLE